MLDIGWGSVQSNMVGGSHQRCRTGSGRVHGLLVAEAGHHRGGVGTPVEPAMVDTGMSKTSFMVLPASPEGLLLVPGGACSQWRGQEEQTPLVFCPLG